MSGQVSDYVLERVREWGVHRIYGYPGDGINGLLGAFDRAAGDPEFIQARHEEMAAQVAAILKEERLFGIEMDGLAQVRDGSIQVTLGEPGGAAQTIG